MKCGRCQHDILPGQLWLVIGVSRWIGNVHAVFPAHVACPTEGEVRRAQLWGRWA